MSIKKIKGAKSYCRYQGRKIIVAWFSPYRFQAWENGKKINLGFPQGDGIELPEAAHAFCDKYQVKQTLQLVR